jgi:subtilisin family serine protease
MAPDDAEISRGMTLLNCVAADLKCGNGAKVAIIDTGVDPGQLSDPNCLHAQQYSTDRPATTQPHDPVGHGTLVARIINRIAPAARLLSIKALERNGNLGGLIAGLYIAELRFRPDIFNLSLALTCDVDVCGSCGNPQGSEAAVTAAQLELLFGLIDQRRKQPLLVAAAGNGTRSVRMPARFPNVLAVGAVAGSQVATYSHYTDIAPDRFILAPGGCAQQPMGQGASAGHSRSSLMFGTSFAAAFISGIAARYLCSTKPGSPCASGRVHVSPKHFLLECLRRSASQKIASYKPAMHGLGVGRYDLATARYVAALPAVRIK